MARISFDPATADHATPKFTVGALYDAADGNTYRYVKFVDAVTYAAGQIAQIASADGKSVTNDRSGGSAVGIRPAGIVLRANTQNYYGFVLVRGYYSAVVTNADDDIAAGDALMIDTGTDGACDSFVGSAVVTGTVNQTTVGAALDALEKQFGMALAADVDAADTVAAYVNCL